MQTPQREFAGAKLQKNIDVGKFWNEKVRRKWILETNPHKIAEKERRIAAIQLPTNRQRTRHGMPDQWTKPECDS
jgi:hypothetical protein